ncbi:MAG: LysR substrate-binding domain-containing protein [Amphritea sp.]
MKFKSIEAFLITVETGSIRAAARKLDLSQPAISKTLKSLELELGVPLFTRGTKGIDLTEFGRVFKIRAATIWKEQTKAIDEIRQLRGEMEGSVSLLLSPAASILLAPTAVRQFRRECPDVTIHMYEGLEATALEKLRASAIEFAICPSNSSKTSKEFVTERLVNIKMAVLGHKNHPLRAAGSLEEIRDADWVHVGAGGKINPLIEKFYRKFNLEPPNVAVECDSFTGSISMIMNSDMIGLVPESWLLDPKVRATCSIIDVKEGPLLNEISLIQRRDIPLTPAAQKLATYFHRLGEFN